MSNLKATSFKIGTEKTLNCITENSDQYAYPIAPSSQTTVNQHNKNQELKKYLKGHHFEFGAKSVKNGQQPRAIANASPMGGRT